MMIFLIGTIGLSATTLIVQKMRKKPINKALVSKTSYYSLLGMNVFLVIFGCFFYDFSTPRPVAFGDPYRNVYQAPEPVDDDWKVSSLTAEGIDTVMYNKVINKLVNDTKYKHMHSLLMVKNGKLVAEDYFYEYHREVPHDLRSANKIITSILMGIAIDKGLIASENEKVIDFFPAYQEMIKWGENRDSLTIKHLLTMNTGLDCNDWDGNSIGNENELYRTEDWIKAFLTLPYKEQAGSQFSYCTFGEILARTIIVKAAGKSFQDFAKEHLFTPLNITNYE